MTDFFTYFFETFLDTIFEIFFDRFLWQILTITWVKCPKCIFSQFFAKNVITFTRFEYYEADPVFAMTIRSNPCIFRLSAIFFQLSPLAEHSVAKLCAIFSQSIFMSPKMFRENNYTWIYGTILDELLLLTIRVEFRCYAFHCHFCHDFSMNQN